MGAYIVKVKFGPDHIRDYICEGKDETRKIAHAAERFGLEYEILLEHKGYQEVIYFLD